jgi:lauroyl/myristoyl acyltransferase
MSASSNHRQMRSETLRSSALLQKEITVTEAEGSRGRHPLSGTRLKFLVFPFLHWALRHSSAGVALLPVRVLIGVMRLLYRWPGNPLRLSCESICRLSRRSAQPLEPRQVYRQFLSNALAVMENYFHLHRYGIDRVSDRIRLATQDAALMRELVEAHGGVILAVPHNVASAFSSLKLNQAFPLLVVARNSPSIARTRVTLDFFERMRVPILMVRGGNRFELSRRLFSVLKKGQVIAATLENIDSSDKAVKVRMFGQRVGLADWAAKIAARTGVPLVPVYFQSRGRASTVIVGEPLITTDIETAVQHYASFFEQHILRDPASWAYLADKRWRRLLADASGATTPSAPSGAD